MDPIITWAARSLHVLGAAVWIGGYAVLVLALAPALVRDPTAAPRRLGVAILRALNGAALLTIAGGLLLVARSRGYHSLVSGGEWGLNIISGAVLAVALLGIGNLALTPLLQPDGDTPPEQAARIRRWAVAGLAASIMALLVMTRAIYARS